MFQQSYFGQVNIPLDAAQGFVADHVLVAELNDLPAFLFECNPGETFVFRGEKPEPGAGTL
jgi:hypothetical protein